MTFVLDFSCVFLRFKALRIHFFACFLKSLLFFILQTWKGCVATVGSLGLGVRRPGGGGTIPLSLQCPCSWVQGPNSWSSLVINTFSKPTLSCRSQNPAWVYSPAGFADGSRPPSPSPLLQGCHATAVPGRWDWQANFALVITHPGSISFTPLTYYPGHPMWT